MAGRARRADEGAWPVRRHRLARVWRAGTARHHLRRDRDEDLLGVDGDHRHLQLASDAGAGGREIRHRAPETTVAAPICPRPEPPPAGPPRTRPPPPPPTRP